MQRGVGDPSLGFRGKKRCCGGELAAKKGGSHGLGRVPRTQLAGPGHEAVEVSSWGRGGGGMGCRAHHSAPRGALPFSSSREAFPQQAQGAWGKDSGAPSEGWAWRPGETSGASFGCSLLAQRPQGHMQAKSPLVTASPKDMQTPRPANGR